MSRLVAALIVVSSFVAAPARAAPPLRVTDLDGDAHVLRQGAVVFLGPECPISRRAVPELNRLAGVAASRDLELVGVISDPMHGRDDAARFAAEFACGFPIACDTGGALARALRPTHVPEAFVFDGGGELVYRGRIDDRFPDLGTRAARPGNAWLEEALQAIAAGEAPRVARTAPVGCDFEAWGVAAPSPAVPQAAIEWNRDVAPILFDRCAACHRGGGVAPFPLLTYEDAASRARMIARVTERRLMPPWHAARGAAPFTDDRRLADGEIEVLGVWADSGAPRGDGAAPAPPEWADGWQLGTPDLVLEIPEPFAVPAGGDDVHRAFVLPMHLDEDRYVRGIEFRPGDPSVVHHALFFLDESGAARALDAADDAPGYESFGGPRFRPAGGLGGWAPGATPFLLDQGVGRRVRAGTDLVMQIHYHPSGKAATDRSAIAIHFHDGPVEARAAGLLIGRRDFGIPAGAAQHRLTLEHELPADLVLLGVTPHMHLLGRSMRVTARLPDGERRVIVDVPRWDFDWQGQYRFVEPVRLPAGAVLELEAEYDNSTANPRNPSQPPRDVRHGHRTTDEMCLCFFDVLVEDEAAYRKHQFACLKLLAGGWRGVPRLLRGEG